MNQPANVTYELNHTMCQIIRTDHVNALTGTATIDPIVFDNLKSLLNAITINSSPRHQMLAIRHMTLETFWGYWED